MELKDNDLSGVAGGISVKYCDVVEDIRDAYESVDPGITIDPPTDEMTVIVKELEREDFSNWIHP